MATTTSSLTAPWLPEHVDRLVIQPTIAASIAAQVATVVRPAGRSHSFAVPIVTADPTAAWTAENTGINATDPTYSHAGETYKKLAGLTRISNEAVDDSDPAVLEVTGAGIARDIARKLDVAFFGDGTTLNGPEEGCESISATDVDAGGYASLDPFAEALSEAEALGATLTAWVAAPDVALTLAQVKDEDNSRRPLLGADPTVPTRRSIFGVPVYVSPAVANGVVYGIPRDRVFVALRKDATVDVDRSAYFGDDATGVRVVTRAAFAFAHEAAVIRIEDGS